MNEMTVLLPFFVQKKAGATELSIKAETVGGALRKVEEAVGITFALEQHLFFLNDRVLDRDSIEGVAIEPGDKLRIMQPMAGG